MRRQFRVGLASGMLGVLPLMMGGGSSVLSAARQVVVMPGSQASPVVPETGSGLLAGRVVDSSGSPVAAAVVSLGGGLTMVGLNTVVQSATAAGQRRVLTHADGRFAFFGLPAGDYSINATKPGYLPGAYGRLRYGGIAQSIGLPDGGRVGNLSIQMWQYAALTGTVIDEAGEPVVGARVWALRRVTEAGRARYSTSTAGVTATTDDRGVFRIATLTPGQYLVCLPSTVATMPVGLVESYQVARQTGTTAEWTRQISGAAGPMTSMLLNAGFRVGDRVVHVGGGPAVTGSHAPGPDDSGRMLVYPTTFYPGTLSAREAQTLTLTSGEERTGIVLPLRLVPATRVSGSVVGPDGPVGSVGVRLVSNDALDYTIETGLDAAVTMTDGGGRFDFLGVPVGQYTIRVLKIPPRPPVTVSPAGVVVTTAAAPPESAGPTLWADQPVSIDESGISDVTVTLQRGVRVRGRFEFDGTQPRPAGSVIQTLQLTFLRADNRGVGATSHLQAVVDASGRISTFELPPGRYIVRYAASLESRQALGQWVFRDATIGGRDVSSVAFDLQQDHDDFIATMTDHPAELSGVVRDAQGRIDPQTAVLIISTNRGGWSDFGTNPVLLRMIRPGKDGGYRLVNFIPGEYYAVAIPEADAGDWQNPDVLDIVVRGAPTFTIRAGEKQVQDVVTRPVR